VATPTARDDMDELRRKADRQLDHRLGNIEDQLTQLRTNDMLEIMTRLTQLDEQSIARTERLGKVEVLYEKLEQRIKDLESGDIKNSNFIHWLERVLWVVFAAGLAWIFDVRH
jgi:hypothetical protein